MSDEKQKVWSCQNCLNFRKRTIGPEHLKLVSKRKLQELVRTEQTEKMGLRFPINYGIWKKVLSRGTITIAWCSEYLWKRRVYELKDGFLEGSVMVRGCRCPKYASPIK